MEKRLSEIPEPKQLNRRLSIVSNSDTAKPENHSSFHNYVISPIQTFFYNHVVRPSKETPLIFSSVILILLSILLLFILLIGSSKSIYLSKFTFDAPIKFITNKNEITFTLYGHCVDDSCTSPSLFNNFDKLPSSSEITGKSSKQKRLDIPTPSIPTPSIPNVPSSVAPVVSTVGGAVTDAANTAANTAGDIAAKAPGLLNDLLSAFDNFKPKSPTANIADTGPGIYLATMSASFLTVATILLCIISCSAAAKSTSKCLRKLRRTKKVNDAEKGDQYSYF
ncbi:13830_t:CDS:2 [Gigaspora rosea]|nr:13830_t:CDS:2 [Gigaspora rosea]